MRARAAVGVIDVEGWGRFVLAWNESGLMLLGLPDRAPGEHLGRLAGRGVIPESTSDVPPKFRDALAAYCSGEPDALAALSSVQPGTEFQRAVWDAVRAIPVGETRHYGAIARAIGKPAAVVAVTNACAANLVHLVVPDHRVVGGAAGAWKQRLLDHEARIRARRA
jgi:O-6-methylguanine DNA methyltransferase